LQKETVTPLTDRVALVRSAALAFIAMTLIKRDDPHRDHRPGMDLAYDCLSEIWTLVGSQALERGGDADCAAVRNAIIDIGQSRRVLKLTPHELDTLDF
jgi:hypothetical protein